MSATAPESAAKITGDTTVSATELALVLGLTARRVQQLAQDGVFLTEERGRYNLSRSVEKYIGTLTAKSKAIAEKEEKKLGYELSIKQSKALCMGLEARELVGKMHRSEDVAAMTELLVYTARSLFAALPGRLAVDVANAKTKAMAADIIRRECNLAMGELAKFEYSAEKYDAMVRERQRWKAEGRTGDEFAE